MKSLHNQLLVHNLTIAVRDLREGAALQLPRGQLPTDPRMTSSSKHQQCLRIEARDPRSDNRRRVVEICGEAVLIRRVFAGMTMAVRVKTTAYRGVALRIAGLDGGRFRYEVKLLHRDPDLSVALADGEDDAAAEAQWRDWLGFLGLPALVGRTDSSDVQVNITGVDLTSRMPAPRARGSSVARRRPRFLRRRKTGAPPCRAL